MSRSGVRIPSPAPLLSQSEPSRRSTTNGPDSCSPSELEAKGFGVRRSGVRPRVASSLTNRQNEFLANILGRYRGEKPDRRGLRTVRGRTIPADEVRVGEARRRLTPSSGAFCRAAVLDSGVDRVVERLVAVDLRSCLLCYYARRNESENAPRSTWLCTQTMHWHTRSGQVGSQDSVAVRTRQPGNRSISIGRSRRHATIAIEMKAMAVPTVAQARTLLAESDSAASVPVLVADQISSAVREVLNRRRDCVVRSPRPCPFRRGRRVRRCRRHAAAAPREPGAAVCRSRAVPGLAAAAALLLDPDRPMSVSEIARVAGLNASSITAR